MCKTVRIEYKCERCGKTETKHAKPRFGIAFVGRYPKQFSKVNKRPLCEECQKAYGQAFNKFMNEKKTQVQGV